MYHAGEAWIDRGAHGKAIAYIWLFLSASMGYEPAKNLRDLVGVSSEWNRLSVYKPWPNRCNVN